MTDLIETMARAMWERPVRYARVPFDALDAEDQDVFRANARAALTAIEAAGYRVLPAHPTEAMMDAFNTPASLMASVSFAERYKMLCAAAPKVTP